MADPYVPLPADDESVDALTADFDDYMATAVPGWVPRAGAIEVAMRAAFADEASTLYTLLRERATDAFRDFGAEVLGVTPGDPAPASTTTTWVARTSGTYTIEGGTTLVIDAPAGAVAFEVLQDVTFTGTTQTGVIVQALEGGSAANDATGTVEFDEPPAWVLSVTVETPATGGTDGQDDDAYLADIRRTAQQLSHAPILGRDWELLAQEVDEVARALVLENYDDTTGLSNQPATVSIFPVQDAGTAVSGGGKTAIAALAAARREANWTVRISDATYNTIGTAITVVADEGVDHATLAATVSAVISDQALNPGRHGQPAFGERRTWQKRTIIRPYKVAGIVEDIEGVADVSVVTLTVEAGGGTVNGDGSVQMAGAAPLPLAGTITVTVVDPS